MFTKKVKFIIVWGGKGKDRMTLITGLISARTEEAIKGHVIKDLKGRI
jgi:hypothetical protein